MIRRLLSIFFVLSFGAMLAACGDTWDGVKEDTKENAEAADEAIEDAVEGTKEAVQ